MIDGAQGAREGWRLVRLMLDDMTAVVEADAETEVQSSATVGA